MREVAANIWEKELVLIRSCNYEISSSLIKDGYETPEQEINQLAHYLDTPWTYGFTRFTNLKLLNNLLEMLLFATTSLLTLEVKRRIALSFSYFKESLFRFDLLFCFWACRFRSDIWRNDNVHWWDLKNISSKSLCQMIKNPDMNANRESLRLLQSLPH